MSNLNNLREKISHALKNGDVTITLGTEEAKLFVREAEKMHGGSCENAELKVQIDRLKRRVYLLEKQLDAAQNVESEDKVKALLPGVDE